MSNPTRLRLRHIASWAAFGLLGSGSLASAQESGGIDYQRDVRPILSDRCFICHGPDEEARRGRLRLDVRESAVDVLEGGADSVLVERIFHEDERLRMPLEESKLVLREDEAETLRRWVEAGAPYSNHWSFETLQVVEAPAVSDEAWAGDSLDRFVRARHEAHELTPSPETDRATWLRRASFDLLGLPPSPAELDSFLADEAPDAYERAADALLARPEYGERMASAWLDVARYSDTYGYQVDRDRFVWPWRDWVVRAFNDGLPYDDFLTWQLAGDLLPDASEDQILATTFNRLHPMKVEGGSVPEEFRVEAVADRLHTTATVFLGLTMECARCHDHKYDPISQRDYYRLYAFFNNIDEAGLYSYFTASVPTPTLLLPKPAEAQRVSEVAAKLAAAEAELAASIDARRASFETWLGARPADAPGELPGQVGFLDLEGAPGGANQQVPGKLGNAVKLSGDDGVGVGVGNFRRFEPFSVSFWMQTPDLKDRAVVFHRSRAWTDAGSRGYQLLLEDGRPSFSLIHFWPGNAVRVRGLEALPLGEWVHCAVRYDGSSRATGVELFLDGARVETEVVQDQLTKNITGGGGDNITIGERFRDKGFTGGLVDDFRVFDRRLGQLEIERLAGGARLAELLGRPIGELEAEDRELLFEHFLLREDGEHRARLEELEAVRKARSESVDGLQEIMVMRERSARRETYVLERGRYDAPTERVEPDTPGALPPMKDGLPRDRLGLARWLTDPEHPLTARVAVNRLWQLCFGQGLVRTPEDFGSQGEPPTHPGLLDHLANEYVASGWDTKALLRRIVCSRTYRQSSRIRPALLERDPEDRLLARSPSYRWPAEMLRDQALAVSDLLVRDRGGAPARPYELSESFKPQNPDTGKGLYRRSLYTYWKRTGPAPAMMALDAAKRDVCRVQRERTSSPLQALVMLNGPQFVEAARILGQNLLEAHGDDDEALLRALFRRLTSRWPDAEEIAVLQRLLAEQTERFASRPEAATRFLAVGATAADSALPPARLAALGVVANTLLNFDACVVKR